MLRNSVVPHIALLVSDESLYDVFVSLPTTTTTITLDGITFFSAGEVAFIQVAENDELRKYQRLCFDITQARGIGVHAYYTASHW